MKPEKASQEVQEELDRLVEKMSREDYAETLGILIADLEIREEAVQIEIEENV